ncbi:MAG: conjugal transfer protein TraF [Ghiorsea sp.]
MLNKKTLYLSLASFCLLSGSASAAEFSPASVRALGMGGSSVASTHGVDASYWNPAAYGFFGEDAAEADNNGMKDKDFGLDVPNVVVGLSVYGPLESNRLKLQAMPDPTTLPSTGVLNSTQIQAAANVVNGLASLDSSSMGVNAFLAGGVGVRVLNYGVGGRATADINISTSIDSTNVGFGNVFSSIGGGVALPSLPGSSYFSPAQEAAMVSSLTGTGLTTGEANAVVVAYDVALAADPTATGQQQQNVAAMNTIANASGTDLASNQTSLSTRGVAISEVGFTYGYAINDELSVGTVLKYMQADIVAFDAKIFSQNTNLNINQNNVETSTGFGLDLGVMYRIPEWQVGLAVRNINKPTFEHSGAGTFSGKAYTYALKPAAKLGAAWIPSDTFTIELGLDLTENEGAVSSSKSQYWNMGIEWDAWNIVALRLGAFQNMSQTDIGLVPTVGLGLNLWAVRVDVGVAASTKKVAFDGGEKPAYLAAGIALASDF